MKDRNEALRGDPAVPESRREGSRATSRALLIDRKFPRDAVIFEDGSIGDYMYLIQEGQVKITKMSEDGREKILEILGPGDFYGEMALLDREPRSASVKTTTACVLLALSRQDFLGLLKQNHELTLELIRELARRLRETDEQIRGLSFERVESRARRLLARLAKEKIARPDRPDGDLADHPPAARRPRRHQPRDDHARREGAEGRGLARAGRQALPGARRPTPTPPSGPEPGATSCASSSGPKSVQEVPKMRVAAILSVLLLAAAVGCTSQEARVAEQRKAANEFFDKKEWSEAKIAYMNLLQLAPNDAEAHYKMAETLWAMQEYGEALWQYKEASRLAPENLEWRMKLAQVLFAARDYDAALEQVSAVLEKEPKNVDALLLRGGLKSVKGDIDGLLEDVDAALAIDPQHQSSLALRAQALGRKGDIAGAEEALRKLVEVKPIAANHLSLARFLAIVGKNDEALVELNAAIAAAETTDERTQARLFLTNFYMNQGQNDKAEEVLLEARSDAPGRLERAAHARALLLRDGQERAGRADARGERDEPARLRRAAARARGLPPPRSAASTRRSPTSIARSRSSRRSEAARLRRAELIVDQQRERTRLPTPESWAIVQEVLKDNPKSLLGLFTEGKFYLLDKKYSEAATSLRRVIDEQPNAAAHVLLGTAYLAQKQSDLARSEFLQALQVDAQYTPARSQLSALYLGAGEDESAAREAKLVLDQNPKDLRIRLILVEALTRLKRINEAREALRPIEVTDAMPPQHAPEDRAALPPHARHEGGAPILEKLHEENPGRPGGHGRDRPGRPRRASARGGAREDRHVHQRSSRTTARSTRCARRCGSRRRAATSPSRSRLAKSDLKRRDREGAHARRSDAHARQALPHALAAGRARASTTRSRPTRRRASSIRRTRRSRSSSRRCASRRA